MEILFCCALFSPHSSHPSFSLSSFPSAPFSAAVSPTPPESNRFPSTKAPSGTSAAVPSAILSSTPPAMLSLTSTALPTLLPTISPPMTVAPSPKLTVQLEEIGWRFGMWEVASCGDGVRKWLVVGVSFLLTIPPSVGYDNNPLSLYYCYEVEGFTKNLKQCIAEDMLGNWSMKTNAPGDNIFVSNFSSHPKLGDYFTASLTGKRISSSAADHALFFWLMPHKVALAIYWEALKLWWKGVAFIQHPRYANVGYRREALIRDMKLQCCPAFSQDIQNHQPLEGSDSDLLKDKNGRNRWFTWRDAKWPWC
ncbi:hypothetical protein HYC85_018840 [Camellia sinensis]|uniref:Uncharacterized protein n=1 Tax=Camellia sinensis TaxID=4442 RepID=A0A7J7GVE1_CAMSI|nr:hypothetical protein HYC85_018840 [Camellia sinensis]